MNLKELYEGAVPKLPGAAEGIQIMTPQQFIAKSAQGEEPEPEQEVAESSQRVDRLVTRALRIMLGGTPADAIAALKTVLGEMEYNERPQFYAFYIRQMLDMYGKQGVAESSGDTVDFEVDSENAYNQVMKKFGDVIDWHGDAMVAPRKDWGDIQELVYLAGGKATEVGDEHIAEGELDKFKKYIRPVVTTTPKIERTTNPAGRTTDHVEWKVTTPTGEIYRYKSKKQAQEHFDSFGQQGVAEATALPASTRELKGQELTDYLDRIRNQDKKKTDKYNLPYVHRSSVVGYYNAEGKKYDTDAIKKGLAQKPEKLLKKNEKMKHSDGAQEQFFNIGFAALVGIALDENTNELIVVNTCPGAGSCKVDCFAMKGGKVQFAGPWLSDGRILTYLLNHPNEFFNQLTSEITKEAAKGQKGGYSVSIRWHDAGDFFSPEYMDMAFKLAQSLPDVKFYAYTKVASAAMANKPANFIINWSEGASTSQEKQIKRNDPNLDTTKNSRIVPSSLFYDLLVKDSKKNLVKGPEGQWQVIPDELPELKQRLADKYGISKNSILSYDEWNTKGKNNKSMKWNVIVAPGEPDLTANDPGVLGTLLLKH